MKDLNRNIAKNISHYMEVLKINQLELSAKLNCANSTVSSWVRGESTPRMDKIDKMCEIFHCTRSDLIAEETKSPEEIIEDQINSIFINKFKTLPQDQKLRLLAYMETLK